MPVLRIMDRCNERCPFCNVRYDDPNEPFFLTIPDIEARLARFPPRSLVELSGGEPTLRDDLPRVVSLAAAQGRVVMLQTNGLAVTPQLARDLALAGLSLAFVSLHGPDSATAQAATLVPGCLERTLAGIEALCSAGVMTDVNCVVYQGNVRKLPDLVELVSRRFHRSVGMTFSLMAPLFRAHLAPGLLFPIPRERRAIGDALTLCMARGIMVTIPQVCGLPPCLLPGYEHFVQLETPRLPGPKEKGKDAGKVKAPACENCAVNTRCLGLWRRYADVFGVDDLRPYTDLQWNRALALSRLRALARGYPLKTAPRRLRYELQLLKARHRP